MPWAYILRLLGPGLHWSKSQAELQRAIAQAERDGRADYLRCFASALKMNAICSSCRTSR